MPMEITNGVNCNLRSYITIIIVLTTTKIYKIILIFPVITLH